MIKVKQAALWIVMLTGLSLHQGTVFAAGDIQAGAAVWKRVNCASCHGADARSPTNPTYPKLAGQYADYLSFALKQYQRGQQADNKPVVGYASVRSNAIMGAFAKQLSERDIQDVSAYLASLPGDLRVQR